MPTLTTALLMLALLASITGCDKADKDSGNRPSARSENKATEDALLQLVLQKPNFTLSQRQQKLDSLGLLISKDDYRSSSLFLYLEGVLQLNSGNSDSAKRLYDKMLNGVNPDSVSDADLIIFKSIGTVNAESDSWVDGKLIDRLQGIIKYAEKARFKYIYEVYDIAAGVYYKYGDTTMPGYYLKLGYEHYPAFKTPSFIARFYHRQGSIYMSAKRWELAERYLDSAYQIALRTRDTVLLGLTYNNLSSIYAQKGDLDKEIHFQNMAFSIRKSAGLLDYSDWGNQALNLYKLGLYKEAIQHYLPSLALARSADNLYALQNAYGGLHDNYLKLKDFEKAILYQDSSYYTQVRILQRRETEKVADITLKYEQEKKDEKIIELNRQASLQAQVVSQQRIFILTLAVCIIAVIIAAITLLRQRKLRLANERLEMAWKQLAMEQQLLRSRMEPHFIYNTLSSVQSFIRHGQGDKAIDYLDKFGGLLRLNLESSRESFVLLSDEVDALEYYLTLQQMRYDGLFDYWIDVYEGYDEDNVMIPPMLVQPFVENAVMHGIQGLGYQGLITVTIRKDAFVIFCTVEDNGKGIKNDVAGNKPSLSAVITEDRLKGLSRQTRKPATLTIENINEAGVTGVRARLQIPFKIKQP